MKPTVSIIVPVYNAEKFLNRCVDSDDWLTSDATKLMVRAAENDYYQAKFGNFTEEEIRQYTLLERKVRENERNILQRG